MVEMYREIWNVFRFYMKRKEQALFRFALKGMDVSENSEILSKVASCATKQRQHSV